MLIQYCDVLLMGLDLTAPRMEIRGNFSLRPNSQRDLQYFMSLEESPVKSRDYFGNHFPTHGWRVRLKRRLGVHILCTYLPTSLYAIAGWISFLIPPESVPGRMALLVTLLLVQVNTYLVVSEAAPSSPDVSSLSLWNVSGIFVVCPFHFLSQQ